MKIPSPHVVVGSLGLVVMSALPAGAQVTFSIDYQGPSISVPDCRTGTPITHGDILAPCIGTPAIPMGPIPLQPPAILISGGVGGLGLPLHQQCVGQPPGAPCPGELDALSYGQEPFATDQVDGRPHYYFSVDRWTLGIPGTPFPPSVNSEMGGAPGAPDDGATDVFVDFGALPPAPIPPGLVGGNHGTMDGNGRLSPVSNYAYPGSGLIEAGPTYPGFPPTAGDNLDALDLDGSLFPQTVFPVYYSLDGPWPDPRSGAPNLGSALANGGFSGGDVLVTMGPGLPPMIWAPAPLLGLDLVQGPNSDDLDALILAENGDGLFQPSFVPYDWLGGGHDMLLFSVRAGSAVVGQPDSIFGAPIEPGDLLTAPMAGGASMFPGIWIPAEALGLATVRSGFAQPPFWDDLDAADYRLDKVLLAAEYCYGDGGVSPGCRPCNCGNNVPPGTPSGCLNSSGTGTRLVASGFACVTADTLQFDISGAPAFSFGVLQSGPIRLPAVGICPPGSGLAPLTLDGLRCIGGGTQRHGGRSTNASGTTPTPWGGPAGPPIGLIAHGGFVAGQSRQWQVFHRDLPTVFCLTGLNTSNAVQVTITP